MYHDNRVCGGLFIFSPFGEKLGCTITNESSAGFNFPHFEGEIISHTKSPTLIQEALYSQSFEFTGDMRKTRLGTQTVTRKLGNAQQQFVED